MDYPYEVPANWEWVKLQDVCAIPITDGTHQTPTYSNQSEGIPFISAKDVTSGHIKWENAKYITKELHEKLYARIAPQIDDVLLAKNGTTGIAAIVETERVFDIYVTIAVLRANKMLIVPKYLFYLVNSLVCKLQFDMHLTGIGVPNLHLRDINVTKIPLAPLPEQHRIVARIESLFSKLDEAKEKAQSVLDGFENRRAAILHEAFTGELTKKWRENHNSFRKIVKILDVCSSLKYGTANKSLKIGKVAVIRMGNLQNGEIDWTNLVYSDDEEDNKKYLLSAGDVLFNRTNSAEHVGKTSIYRGEIPAIYAGYLIKIDYDRSHIVGDYLNYLLNSPEAREYCNRVKSDAVNQSNINAQKIGAFTIPLIDVDEQQEIVRILDRLLSQEQQTKQAAEAVIAQIDVMKKSILARAFRGEIGTNDPSDELVRI